MSDNNFGQNNPPGYSSPEEQYEESSTQSSAVASPPAKNFIFIALVVLILGTIVYFYFTPKKEKVDSIKEIQSMSNRKTPISITPPPPVPTPQITPPPVVPVTPPAEEEKANIFDSKKNPDKYKRIQSGMLVTKPGLLGSSSLGSKGDPNDPNSSLTQTVDDDPNVGFADRFYNQKDVPIAVARKLGNTGRLITQGKIIEAILETPINTDVPGMIRAIVSRDIYAESGRTILLPKGSRLVGTYNNFVIRGNKRVNVIWTRVIRPDGIDIMIRSSGTDQLGRAGIEGEVDNKYTEIFASAFLVSAINIAVGVGTDAIDPNKGNNSTTTNSNGSTTSQNSSTHDAALKAVDLFGSAGTNLVNGFINLKPTITIDQGTRVNVFVNRDLVFPANLVDEVKFIK